MNKKQNKNHRFINLILVPVISIALLSCSSDSKKKDVIRDVFDPYSNLSREDYEDKLLPPTLAEQEKNRKNHKGSKDSTKEPSIPDAAEILTAPTPPEAGPDKLVSISITEDVPLKDVLIELGRLADVDMEIDPGISGGIIFKATNRPFNEVIKQVADLGNLKYESKNGAIRMMRDVPYQVNYVTDFLNIVRSSSGSVSVSTNVIGGSGSSGSSGDSSSSSSSSSSDSGSSSSGGGSSGGGNITSGSSSQISSSYEGDLWGSVGTTVASMINDNSSSAASTTDGAAPSTAATQSSVNINRQAGIISVVATSRQHNNIESYLNFVKKNVSSQVLIEAKIVEVTLDKSYSAGIDWGTLSDANIGLKVAGNFNPISSTETSGVISIGSNRSSLSTLVKMLEKFGTSHTISSPRLHAMNNQQAVMTVARNKVYFTVSVEETTSSAVAGTDPGQTSSISSTLHTVPIGIIMTLQPSINLETNEVTMNIRPTLTTTNAANDIADPAVALASQRNIANGSDEEAVTSVIPVIDVRELDSVMKIKSGEVMVMGGLMKNEVANTDTGVPVISRVPFFGNAFKSVNKSENTIETVIFIKATIIPSEGSVSKADKDLYKNFIRDPRPLAF